MEETNTDEDLQELKNILRVQLQKTGVGGIVRHMIREISIEKGISDVQTINPDDVLQEIYKRGLMTNILESLKIPSNFNNDEVVVKDVHDSDFDTESDPDSNPKMEIHHEDKPSCQNHNEEPFHVHANNNTPKNAGILNYQISHDHDEINVESARKVSRQGSMNGKFYMKIEILGGRAFLDHLFQAKNETNVHKLASNCFNNGSKSQNSIFTLHVLYKSQRFCTKRVQCRPEPQFKDSFMIDVGYFENGIISHMLDASSMLKLILVHDEDTVSGKRTLLSHCLYDWRQVLMARTCSQQCSVELKGIGPEHNVPIGLLNIRLTVLPALNEQLTKATFLTQVTMEKCKQDEKERLYLVYTRQWWEDFIEIRLEHQQRLVKLFSYDENTVSRPVQTFVQQLAADRLITTPYQAAWFVALIPLCYIDNLSRISSLAAGQSSSASSLSSHWQTIESTILSRSGGVEDHAIVLCSLFLGFGLDCYVAVGTKFGNIPWIWVMTLDKEFVPTFWESTTGRFFMHSPREEGELYLERINRIRENEKHNLKSLDCLFNNKILLANIQPSSLLENIDWNLLNPSKWKQIPECTIHSYQSSESVLQLSSPTQCAMVLAMDLELELKLLVSNTRMSQKMNSKWDNTLSVLLSQELARYETEVSTGGQNFPSNLENAIMKYIPAGYDFKAYPFHFTGITDAKKVFYECVRETKIEEIIYCRGADVQLAVRVDVFIYPEDITSVRLMFACKYLSTS